MDAYNQLIQRATEHYRALRISEAVDDYRKAIAMRPDVAGLYNNLGSALMLLGRPDEAITALLACLRLTPDAFQAWSNLGNLYKLRGDLDSAIAAYQQAIRINPDNAESHNNLGATMEDAGDVAVAIECYQRAAALKPDSAAIGSNLIYSMHFSEAFDAAAILAAHRQWNERHAKPLCSALPLPAGEGAGRRLRIGYISPDFKHHVVGRFMLPILENHDRSAFEIFCYSDVLVPDEMTAKLKSHADHWCVLRGQPDEMAAGRIRKDDLDLLIDLTMHMARNRMRVFAMRPARMQATYLAYCSTTGLDAMDYRLTDPYFDPPAAEDSRPPGDLEGGCPQPPAWASEAFNDLHHQRIVLSKGEGTRKLPYTERSVYLPSSYWCYAPPVDGPDVSATPAIANGYVTFGCLNNFAKVSPSALAMWAKILVATPNSRLILHAKEGAHRRRTLDTLAALGVAAERVEFVASVPFRDYFELYSRIDLALDPFPYGGGTTTLDGLWMGVPIITLAGETAVGRGGISILRNLGLTELIARSKPAYAELSVTLAGDLPRLESLRRGMRDRMKGSILTDAPRFTREFEGVLHAITS